MQPTEVPLTPPPADQKQKQGNFFLEIAKFSIIALIIVLPIRFFVAQPFIVSGASMEPTFETGEYLIVDELSYRFEPPKRGEVIIFRYPKDTTKFFIKRIIGLPGETVEMRGKDIYIHNGFFPDGFKMEQPYLESSEVRSDYLTVTLGSSEYFVLGDNRGASSDSRIWGNLPSKDIIGRAFIRLFPLSRLNFLPGDATNETPL
ncbi:MAG TPA: signal peptidase I [Candidatus Paceibacterota bacterium]